MARTVARSARASSSCRTRSLARERCWSPWRRRASTTPTCCRSPAAIRLAERGRLVLVGLLAGGSVEIALHTLLRRRLRLIGSVLRYRSRAEKAELVRGFGDFALPRLEAGRLRPVVGRAVPFADVARAYADLAKGGGHGKIVLDMGRSRDGE